MYANTVWKFEDFSIIQILREINFVDSRSAKTAGFAILGAMTFGHLVNFSLQKVQKFIKKSKFRATTDPGSLIWNFHILKQYTEIPN